MQQSIAVTDRREHRQIFSLNLIRAVAILMVLFDHSLRRDLTVDAAYMIRLLLAPDAVLFFMVSGALLLPVTGSWSDFLRRRIIRVFVPFVVWVMVYALVYYWLGWINEYSLATQIRWSWMSFNFLQGWFIPAMMGVYLIMPMLSPWIATASRRQFHYVAALWVLAGMMPFCQVLGGVNPQDTPLSLFINAVPYAIIGYYITRYCRRCGAPPRSDDRGHSPIAGKSKAVRRYARYLIMLAVGVVIPFLIRDASKSIDMQKVCAKWWGICTISTAVLYFSMLINVRTIGKTLDKVVNFLARYSYGIYLTHWLIGGILVPHWFPALAHSTPLIFLIQLAGSLLLTIALSRIPFLGRYLV